MVQVPKNYATYEMEDFDWVKAKQIRDLMLTKTNGAVMDVLNMSAYEFVQQSEEVRTGPPLLRQGEGGVAPKRQCLASRRTSTPRRATSS